MIEHRSKQSLSIDQETSINTQLKKLIDISFKLSGNTKNKNNGLSLAASCDNVAYASTLLNGMDNDPFYLALVATRHIHIRRLSALVNDEDDNAKIENSTYDLLKQKYSKHHPKYLLINLDELNSTITCIKSIQSKKVANKDTFQNKEIKLLNARGIKIVDSFVRDCNEWMKSLSSKEDIENESILADNAIHQGVDSFIRMLHDAKGHCLRAISLYREFDAHEICIKYCDFCLDIISMINSAAKKLSRGPEKNENDEDKDMRYFEADIMAMKAYSLTKSKQYMRGKACARDAWEKGLTNPRVCNMVVLFHCTVAQETNDNAQDAQQVNGTEIPVSNSLLELDNAIKHIMREFRTSQKSDCVDLEILSTFPCLIDICKEYEDNGKGLILLGVQERQITMITRSKLIKDQAFQTSNINCFEDYFSKSSS